MLKFILLLSILIVSVLSKKQGNGRIVGGVAAPEHVPYMVSLQYPSENSNSSSPMSSFMSMMFGNSQMARAENSSTNGTQYRHFCGGSISNENNIITAAHCLQGLNFSLISIFAGESDLNNESGGSRYMVENCTINSEFLESSNTSDIAVCRLQMPFNFSDNIQPIEYTRDYVGGGENCLLTGWGSTSRMMMMPPPNRLQEANFTTLTNEDCNERGGNVSPREICAASRGRGACKGDDGGPLQCNGILVGVLSFTTGMCATNRPDVYTRASEYVDFLNDNGSE